MKPRIISTVVLFALFAVATSGCYHTKITTGKRASSVVIDKPWAKSFINGLVPPDELDVSADCPDGVAMVETEQSFLNLIANAATFGIFSPMHLKVTCAAGPSTSALHQSQDEIMISRGADENEVSLVLTEAANRSAEVHGPVMLRFVD